MSISSKRLLKAVLVLVGVVVGVLALESKEKALISAKAQSAQSLDAIETRMASIESSLAKLSSSFDRAVEDGIRYEIKRIQGAEQWDLVTNQLSVIDARTILLMKALSSEDLGRAISTNPLAADRIDLLRHDLEVANIKLSELLARFTSTGRPNQARE